jgi:hypothetical protein
LLRPARALITKHFTNFIHNGTLLSKGCDHWTTERWIEKITLYIEEGLKEDLRFDIEIYDAEGEIVKKTLIKVLLLVRTTMDSRLLNKKGNKNIKEANKFSQEWKKEYTPKIREGCSEIYRRPSEARLAEFFSCPINVKMWELFVKTSDFQDLPMTKH